MFLKVLKFFVTDFVTVTVTFVTDINNNGLYQYCLMTFLLTVSLPEYNYQSTYPVLNVNLFYKIYKIKI